MNETAVRAPPVLAPPVGNGTLASATACVLAQSAIDAEGRELTVINRMNTGPGALLARWAVRPVADRPLHPGSTSAIWTRPACTCGCAGPGKRRSWTGRRSCSRRSWRRTDQDRRCRSATSRSRSTGPSWPNGVGRWLPAVTHRSAVVPQQSGPGQQGWRPSCASQWPACSGRRRFTSYAEALAAQLTAALDPAIGRTASHLLFHQIHLTNNRLGIAPHQEAVLAEALVAAGPNGWG